MTFDTLVGKLKGKPAFAQTVVKRFAFFEFMNGMVKVSKDRFGDELRMLVWPKLGTLADFLGNFASADSPVLESVVGRWL